MAYAVFQLPATAKNKTDVELTSVPEKSSCYDRCCDCAVSLVEAENHLRGRGGLKVLEQEVVES
jgi:hypothetical protein